MSNRRYRGGRGEFVLASSSGTVRVYTRKHFAPCALTNRNENYCSCPKWIYFRAVNVPAKRQAAKTPHFSEACEIAEAIFRSFKLEIVRAVNKAPAMAPAETPIATPPASPPAAKSHRGREITKSTRARIELVALLELEGVRPYAMTDRVFPPAGAKTKMTTKRKRFERLNDLIELHRNKIDLEKQRVILLRETARNAIAS